MKRKLTTEQEKEIKKALTSTMMKHGMKDPVYCWLMAKLMEISLRLM